MYRKGVSALIINKNQEFLLVNLISFKDRYFAIPGGGLEENETPEDAVYREIQEELGIDKESLKFVGKGNTPIIFKFKVTREDKEYEGSERHFFGFHFIGSDNEIKLKENEVRTYKWVSFTELKKFLLFDNQLDETREKILEIFSFLKV